MTGFRTWTTGDSVSASDFTSYIATQSVLIFADASARSSAVTSPVNGMVSSLTTDNVISIYNGSAWVDVIDIDTLTVSGGNYTMTGSLTLTGGTPIVLEGATADAYETSIAVTDPTADRTITLPNVTGTVVTTGNPPTALGTLTGGSPIVLEGATANAYETTVAVTDPTADRTITLPDATGTVSLTDGITFSGSTANGVLTYHDSTTAAVESTAAYASDTLTLSGAGGGLKVNGLNSSDANTLDDYEEGTWTAAIATGSGSITIHGTRKVGSYIKIGQLVFVSGAFGVASVSSPSGTLNMTGLPFAPINGLTGDADRFNPSGYIAEPSAQTLGVFTRMVDGVATIEWRAGTGETAEDGSIADIIDASSQFYLSGCYRAAT
jgi:hypothetical protein|tara:strand:- start:586 stop:1725 length:1140 start_codon:yes stop_codon:yes gene_type:complete